METTADMHSDMEPESENTPEDEAGELEAGELEAGSPPAKDAKAKGSAETPKTFAFEHAFFRSVQGSYFCTLEDTGEPVMMMALEQGNVSLKLKGIAKELELTPDEPDAKLLETVRESLKYVREIRVDDPVPSELTTGKASWDVTDAHRAIAHNRVTMQLVSWMSGDEMLITDPTQLAQVVNDPKTKAKINSAFSEAARALGIDEDDREVVIQLISNLANELAYIEALRDKFNAVQTIRVKVSELEKKYKSEQSVVDTILPIKRLFKIALDGFKTSFEQLDAQTGEILSALTNIAPVTKYIRANRDDLHRRLWAWDHLINQWQNLVIKRSGPSEKLLQELYHFLAQRFLPRNEWELYSKALEKTKKRSTEMIW